LKLVIHEFQRRKIIQSGKPLRRLTAAAAEILEDSPLLLNRLSFESRLGRAINNSGGI
jgi:hypothetical protein